jgi:hypothetical protein
MYNRPGPGPKKFNRPGPGRGPKKVGPDDPYIRQTLVASLAVDFTKYRNIRK